jgi:predicted permease
MTWIDGLVSDLRSAGRSIRHTPWVAAVVVLSVGVGIGANTVVFSWLESFTLRPLPGVERAHEFHFVEPLSGSGAHPGSSWLEYRDLRARLDMFDDLLAFRMAPLNLGEAGRTERVFGQLVSGNYFPLLGLRPVAGQLLRPEDAEKPGANPVAVVSYDFWQTRLGGDPGAVGRPIRLNGRELTILGIAPQAFQGTVLGLSFDVWVPATMAPVLLNGSPELDERGVRGYAVMGRLRPGMTAADAQAAVDAAMADLAATFPDTNRAVRAEVLSFWEAPRGPQRRFASALLILQGLMVVLLVAVSGNAASLMLARAASRQRECAVRLALGAGSGRIVSLVLAEHVLLAVAGGLIGAVLAVWGTTAVRDVPMIGAFPIRFQTGVDLAGFGFAMALAVLSGVLFGAAPAVSLSRVGPYQATRGRDGTPVGAGLRELLMGAEVALALIVLVAAALFLRNFERTRDADTGFRRDGVLLAAYDLTGRDSSAAASRAFATRLMDDLRSRPNVDRAAISAFAPLDLHGMPSTVFTVEGRARTDGVDDRTLMNIVTPGYFDVLEIPLLSGRDFVVLSDEAAPPEAIVNEAFVEAYLESTEPLGRLLDAGRRRYVITGVVATTRYESFDEPPTPLIYFSYRDRPAGRGEIHVVERSTSSTNPASDVERSVRNLDPVMSAFDVRTMNQHVERNLFLQRIPARMFAVLGPLLVVLAAIGIYAVVAYTVARRTREIGVRLALGATGPRVVAGIVWEHLAVVGVGVLAGLLLAAIAVTRFVPGVSPDAATFVGVPLLLVSVAAVACWVPARRAAAVDPVLALRQE